MTEERYSPLMLTSEHNRILGAAQARYDENMTTLYQRGKWDGVAIGLTTGCVLGLVCSVGLFVFLQGWL